MTVAGGAAVQVYLVPWVVSGGTENTHRPHLNVNHRLWALTLKHREYLVLLSRIFTGVLGLCLCEVGTQVGDWTVLSWAR